MKRTEASYAADLQQMKAAVARAKQMLKLAKALRRQHEKENRQKKKAPPLPADGRRSLHSPRRR